MFYLYYTKYTTHIYQLYVHIFSHDYVKHLIIETKIKHHKSNGKYNIGIFGWYASVLRVNEPCAHTCNYAVYIFGNNAIDIRK